MGRAYAMKKANKNGKLTLEERAALSGNVIDYVREEVGLLLGGDTSAFTDEDIQARIAFHVRFAKMNYVSSGMIQLVMDDEFADLLRKKIEEEDEEDEDE